MIPPLLRNRETWIILGITLLAFILRIINIGEMSFSNDELSAIIRLRHDSLGDLIRDGIAIDGHPAAAQILLFYWTKLVGYNEFAVRLPFVLAGTLSIPLVYDTAKKLFGQKSGLLAAILLASSEIFILYSRLARPYALGLFGAVLMLWALIRISKVATDKNRRLWGTFVIGALIASYSHHVACLTAFIIGGFAFMILERKQIRNWIIASGIVVLLYSPNLIITLRQLKLGGVGQWLAAPEPDFILEHIHHIFNYSWALVAIIFLLAIVSLVQKEKTDARIKDRVYLFLVFIIPLAVTYIYSVVVNPVLQHSVLLFSAAPLLILASSYLPVRGMRWQVLEYLLYLAILISITNYTVYKNEQFKDFKGCAENLVQLPNDSVIHLMSINHSDYINFYLDKSDVEIDFAITKIQTPEHLRTVDSLLRNDSRPYISLSTLMPLRPETQYLITNYATESIRLEQGHPDECRLFIRLPDSLLGITPVLQFNWMSSEYSMVFPNKITEVQSWPGITTVSQVEFKCDEPSKYLLVCVLEDVNGELLQWNGMDLDIFGPPDTWNRAWLVGHYQSSPPNDVVIKTYVWNKNFTEGDSLQFQYLKTSSMRYR